MLRAWREDHRRRRWENTRRRRHSTNRRWAPDGRARGRLPTIGGSGIEAFAFQRGAVSQFLPIELARFPVAGSTVPRHPAHVSFADELLMHCVAGGESERL